jgi:hypothetical protein
MFERSSRWEGHAGEFRGEGQGKTFFNFMVLLPGSFTSDWFFCLVLLPAFSRISFSPLHRSPLGSRILPPSHAAPALPHSSVELDV